MAFSQADIEAFDRATPEAPVLITGTFWTEHPVDGHEVLASRGTAAIIGQNDIDDSFLQQENRYKIAYLDQEILGDPQMINRRFGDWGFVKLDEIQYGEVTFDPKVVARYDEYVDLHKNAPFTVVGRLFSEEPTYSPFDLQHEEPIYEPIEGSEKVWDLSEATLKDGTPVNSLRAVDEWMVENHPSYYMGYNAVQNCPSGEFVRNSVPGQGYPEGMSDTFEHRMDYVRMYAKELGVKIGFDETQQALRELNEPTAKMDVLRKERRLPDISGIIDVPNGPDYMMPGDY